MSCLASHSFKLLWSSRRGRWYYLRLFILIGVYTGARHEAILSLTWEQINFEDGRIDFRRRKNGKVLSQTKKRRPNASAHPRLMTFLGYARRRAERIAAKKNVEVGKYVIEHRGGPLRSVKKSFSEACARAGIEGATAHTMKHTCITWLLRDKVPAWQVAGVTATSLATIERVYGHHIQDDLQDALKATLRRRVAKVFEAS